MRINMLRAGSSTLLAVALLIVTAFPAAAQTVTYKNLATGFCLDSNANRQVYTLGCNGGSYQKWTVSNAGNGTVTLKNSEPVKLFETALRRIY